MVMKLGVHTKLHAPASRIFRDSIMRWQLTWQRRNEQVGAAFDFLIFLIFFPPFFRIERNSVHYRKKNTNSASALRGWHGGK